MGANFIRSVVCILWLSFLVGLFGSMVQAQGVRDAELVIHENLLNKFLTRLGEVSGTGQMELKKGFIKWTVDYRWRVWKPWIEIEPGGAQFRARAQVKADGFSYSPDIVKGR